MDAKANICFVIQQPDRNPKRCQFFLANGSNGGFSYLDANDNNFGNTNNNGSGRVASVGREKVRISEIPF